LYGAFVWARRALNNPKRRFPARADEKCAGWNLPGGAAGGVCELMAAPLQPVDNAQAGSACKAGESWPNQGGGGGGGGQTCWYEDPRYNTSFASVCGKEECACKATEEMPMGREIGAMCDSGGHHHHGRRSLRQLQQQPPGKSRRPARAS
jgi:hypothetical protein